MIDSAEETNRRISKLPIWKVIIFSFIPLLVLVLLIELLTRAVYSSDKSRQPEAGYIIPDEELLWKLNPIINGVEVTNSDGFRDRPFNHDARFKVLLLGDSVSWGDSIVNINKIYPQILEDLINTEHNDLIEVMNTGTPGYSTFQEARLLRKFGPKYTPDMVILQFCLNDVLDRYNDVSEYGGKSHFQGVDTLSLTKGLNGFLLRNSRTYLVFIKELQEYFRGRQELDVKSLTQKITPFIQSAWDNVFDEIDDIHQFTIKHNIPFMVLVAPYRFQLENSAVDAPQRILSKYAQARQIHILDLLPHFRQVSKDYPGIQLFNDANHFSIDGHDLAAYTLKDALTQYLSGSM